MAGTSAVVVIKDVQYRVQQDDVVEVPRLQDEVGAKVEFDQVLMVSGDDVQVGTPTVEGAKVTAEVLGHGRGEKIIVFKMKRRKNYRRRNGHRQAFSTIRIQSIQG
jgi:large subunit ribosomal protein L21